MRRKGIVLGILGLICVAALPASAQGQVKLFGQDYYVISQSAVKLFGQNYVFNGSGGQSRGGTYKNGVKITLSDPTGGTDNYAGIYFSEGTSIANDRLWFAARINNGANATGDQIYYLEGSDASGIFSTAVSNAKSFFGGNVNRERGGRPVSVIELNRDETRARTDRNILVCTFWDDDALRLFDIDSMTTDRITDSLFMRHKPGDTGTQAGSGAASDPNLPNGNEPSFAHLPTPDGHTVLVASGPGANGQTGIGIWDTRQNDAYPVLTDVTAQTKSAAKAFPQTFGGSGNLNCIRIARYGNQGQYWFLLSEPEPGGGETAPRNALLMVRATLTLPANPATAKPDDIKMTVLDIQDLNDTAADILFPKDSAGMVGVAVGREVRAGGPRVIYTTDFSGNFYTLIPAS